MATSNLTPGVNNNEWTQAADKAKEAASTVAEMAVHAAAAVGTMASQTASEVGRKADELAATAGVGIQEFGNRLSTSTPREGVLGSASQAVAKTVTGGGQYLQGAKLSGITDVVATLIRRNPLTTVLIAVGLGWFVGRKLRS